MPTATVQRRPSRPNSPLRAAIYCRVSSSEQQSLDGQEADLAAYCRARGWEPVAFRDTQTGADATRPALDALLHAARRREVGAVVCVKLDRLGRSLSHFAALLHELQALRVGLVCVTQGIDTVTEAGRLNPATHFFVTVLAAVAEFERELIRERTLDGLQAARTRGTRLGRPSKMTVTQHEQILGLKRAGQIMRGHIIQRAVAISDDPGSLVCATAPRLARGRAR